MGGINDHARPTGPPRNAPNIKAIYDDNGDINYVAEFDDCNVEATFGPGKGFDDILFIRSYCNFTNEEVVDTLKKIVSESSLAEHFDSIGHVIYGISSVSDDLRHLEPLIVYANHSKDWAASVRRIKATAKTTDKDCDSTAYKKMLTETNFFRPLREFF